MATNKTLTDELITLIESVANNNPAPMRAEIVKTYSDGYVNVRINNEIVSYLECVGEANTGDIGVVCTLDTDEMVVVTGGADESGNGGGFGSFYINTEGHLIVVIPSNVNPYRIDENGHLIYDTEAS